ncbi:MAG: HAD family hydrolase [Planctomycetes bacterium]|nr:HAD family hydrolase [Planctomycetota bacterium]MCB9904287.1 HAD family hydrolase [Planctomycetota bacterium]
MPPPTPRPLPRGILFDLDGTLYRLAPVRRRMLAELCVAPLVRFAPLEGLRTLKRLGRFRRVREELRELGRAGEPLESLQYRRPAELLGEPESVLRATVAEWMFERPLRHLAAARREGVRELIDTAAARGIAVGVFSDYPARAKLAALGLDAGVDLTLCATDPEVNAFKPHPTGFLAACERWGFQPHEVLYVGDRIEVDHAGAVAAGLECALVGGEAAGHPAHTTFAELRARFGA